MKRSENYFDREENVRQYIQMTEGYDATEMVQILKKYLASNSTLLELGMGPGIDLDLLSKDYIVTGSDFSEVFLNLYKERKEETDLLHLDAVTIQTERKFDCIFSNKVLHQFSSEDLRKSFQRQKEVLEKDGLLFHTFWAGDGEEAVHGMRFFYYGHSQLQEFLEKDFEILALKYYGEMKEKDSIYVVARKKS